MQPTSCDETQYLAHPWWMYGLIGIAAGFLSTFFGIGGGIVMIPLLNLWLRMPIKLAVGTSVFVVIGFTLLGATLEAVRYPDHILWEYVGLMAVGSIVGVSIGKVVHARSNDGLLKILFALMLTAGIAKFLGISDAVAGEGSAVYEALLSATQLDNASPWAFMIELILASILGLLAGIASALTGTGGGVIYVPGLVILFAEYSSDLHPPRATSMATVVLTSLWGGYLHSKAGNVVTRAARLLMLLGTVGAIGGVFAADAIANRDLLTIFGAFLALFAVLMLISGIRDLRRGKRPDVVYVERQ